MMDAGLSDKQKLLLKRAAVQSRGIIHAEDAYSLYSSKSSAKSALATLEFQGFIRPQAPGIFEIEKLPGDVKEKVRERLDEAEA